MATTSALFPVPVGVVILLLCFQLASVRGQQPTTISCTASTDCTTPCNSIANGNFAAYTYPCCGATSQFCTCCTSTTCPDTCTLATTSPTNPATCVQVLQGSAPTGTTYTVAGPCTPS